MRAIGWLPCGVMIAGMALAAEEPTLGIEVDRGSITVGDPLRLELSLTAPADQSVTFPGEESALAPFELLERGPQSADTLGSGDVRHRRLLVVSVYRPGPSTLPPLEATLRGPAGVTVARSESLTVDVVSLLEEAGADSLADIRALKEVIDLPVPPVVWPWVVAVVAVVVAVVASWLWKRHRRNRVGGPPAPVIDRRSPDAWALDELAGLLAEDLPARRAFKEHYTRLTDVVRPYLERRFGVHTMDRTSGEILDALEQRGEIALQETRRLGVLLEEADLAKFACLEPPVGAARGAVEQAVQFVRATARRSIADHGAPEVSR